MLFLGNKIDKLVKQQSELLIKKQNIQDKMKETNSNIENKIQRLENKAFVIKQTADSKIAEIDRQYAKNLKQIQLEKDYYNSIGNDLKDLKWAKSH